MSFPSPLLHIPTRTTQEADFSEPFSEYIASVFEQDSSKFKHEIGTLNRLRQDMRGAGKDLTGRDILYRYYGQLELLDLRFPFDENHVDMAFLWKDSFTAKECSQHSIAFEKASVLYNLGAICSSIAALQNRFEADGLRMAYNYFQASAGLFSFINENFLHAPSVDMSRDSIKTLTELALAQAQECFLEKVTVVEKKKGNLASKLCAQLAFMYVNVLDGFSLESVIGQFEKTWVELIKIKSKLFLSLAYYHRHLQYEIENHYGLSISHLMVAETNIKEANKLAEKFAYNFPNFNISSQSNEGSTTGKNPSSASTALLEITKIELKAISDKLIVAKRDNDMIYHDNIPSVDTLPPLEKLNSVKAIPFADLLQNGQADIPKIVGSDIFAKLIPMSVHESSSVYSEEKSKLYRSQQKIVKEADDEIDATIRSLNLLETMEQIKAIYANPNLISGEILPVDVMNWSVRLKENEMKSSKYLTDDMIGTINSLKPQIQEMLIEIQAMLDKEQLDCENMRVKHMNSWSQDPSSSLTFTIRNELKAHHDSYGKAIALDNPIIKELDESKNIIAILNRPIDKLESYLVHQVVSAVPFSDKDGFIMDKIAAKGESNVLGEQISIEKIDSLLHHLRSLKTDRANILDEMKDKIKKDDISSLLLLNKNKEKQIFQSELTKYAQLQTKISSNIDSHKQFLSDLVNEFKKLSASSEALSVIGARNEEKNQVFTDWKIQYEKYKAAKDGLKKGRIFYTDLKSSLDELKAKVIKFVNQRNSERVDMEKNIEAEFAERGQRAIKDQLEKLSVASSSAPTNLPSSYYNPQVSILGQSGSSIPTQRPHIHSGPEAVPHFAGPSIPKSPPMNEFGSPTPLVTSPQYQAIDGNQNQSGSRTPIPPSRSRRQSINREPSGSSLDVDHSPTSNLVENYPRATFDAEQFATMVNRQQQHISPQSFGMQGEFNYPNKMYDQYAGRPARSNSPYQQGALPQGYRPQQIAVVDNSNRAAKMPVQVARPNYSNQGPPPFSQPPLPNQGFSPQNPNGMGQFQRDNNMPHAELYRAPSHYAPSGYGAPPSGPQTPGHNFQQRPQGYPPQGYQTQGHRPNVPDGGVPRYPVPADAYNPRAGFVRGPVGPPYRSFNQAAPQQGYPGQPPASTYGGYNGPNQSRPPIQDYSRRPPPQDYNTHQRPVPGPTQEFNVQGGYYPPNYVQNPYQRPSGYVQNQASFGRGYRPIEYGQAAEIQYQQPSNGAYGNQQTDPGNNSQNAQYVQYVSYNDPDYQAGDQNNHRRSLMD